MATTSIFGYKDEIKPGHHIVHLMLNGDCRYHYTSLIQYDDFLNATIQLFFKEEPIFVNWKVNQLAQSSIRLEITPPPFLKSIPENNPTIMKLQPFLVKKNSFRNAKISLTPIWNYNPNIPQTTQPPPFIKLIEEKASFQSSQEIWLTTLKHHQIQAPKFLKKR
ncbi:hypothetical protein VP01_3603g1 [Puccinia sorghi]|uniref:Uncharacterized protein n=1 Tax=Puccinia sorghi TaxID=27349 RepID=A0A0L6UX02_9BASI|nr:hypothetical protein VP01_3603g1 [Puccinia sorghi]